MSKYISIGILLASVLLSVFITAEYKDAIWQEKITAEQNAKLQEVMAQEREASARASALEREYHDQTKTVDRLATDNRRLASELNGLRDPYAGNKTNNTAPTCPTCKPCDGKLSTEATEFLLNLTREADELRTYANLCYKWVSEIERNK